RFETLIGRALGEGRVADAQELIVQRNQIVEGLQPTVPSDAGGGGRPGGSDGVLVSVRDVQVLESLVVRSRTAGMPEGELTGWQERFEQAVRQGPGQVGELGRLWHEHLEQVTGGSRPGVDALLDAGGVLSVDTVQEALARAASDAGVPMVEHATWMRQIREAWASGHREHATALVERFWTRIGEAHAERSAGLELELLQARAGLRDMPVEEFWARKEQGDTAETALRDGLEKTLEQLAGGGPEQAAGLREKLRSLVDALPEDLLLPSRLGEGVREILDASDAGTPAHRLRDDVRSLLEGTSGEWDSLTSLLDGAESEVRIARTEGLDGVPQGDAVWAVGLKESYTHHSGEQGMPGGEIAYWNTRLDEALASGDREAAVGVARDWHF
ncbi:hypothetical protein, partial [Streptomyces sp. NPDC056632]|uniref:hypothetical protein n=1 Tax=Streptomyces sp. NPDC056632 TaxID=3345884 RepID=UPI0036AE69E2